VLLTGCASTLSDSAADINKVNYPIVVEYDAQTQDKAAVELESGACPVLAEMTVDYGQMRDETRVLLGQKVNVDR
jgi:hypothetical protein